MNKIFIESYDPYNKYKKDTELDNLNTKYPINIESHIDMCILEYHHSNRVFTVDHLISNRLQRSNLQ
jgi:hypothetical protein